MNMLMLLLAVLVSSAANGQVMLCCLVSDEKSLVRDFGFGNCRKVLSAMGFYLHVVSGGCEGQRDEIPG